MLTKHVQRSEPFWHVTTSRAVDFSREINYPVDVGNAYATKVMINGNEFSIAEKSGKRGINISAVEYCHRKIGYQDHIDGLGRESKKGMLDGLLRKYNFQEHDSIRLKEAIPLKVPVSTLLQRINRTLSSEAINAHEIQQDFIAIEKAHLCYRPAFAFEFVCATEDKVEVIEVDGLTGEVIENGQWFKEKMETIPTREMLFEASAKIAGVIVPGASFAMKIVKRMTAPH